jgi:hypothetical protein
MAVSDEFADVEALIVKLRRLLKKARSIKTKSPDTVPLPVSELFVGEPALPLLEKNDPNKSRLTWTVELAARNVFTEIQVGILEDAVIHLQNC